MINSIEPNHPEEEQLKSIQSDISYETRTATLYNVQISELYDRIKGYFKYLKFEIIYEEKEEDYWDLKAHKGGKASVIVGNVRDVEIMISGAKSTTPYYDIVLRTGAWGKDIIVPTVIAGALTAGLAAAPVAAIEAYRAHSFEKKFWEFITSTLSDIGEGKATMSTIVTVTP
jgi:hypothetical protein